MRAELGLGVLVLGGCAGNGEYPDPPDPAMVDVLVEVHLAEARASVAGADVDSARVAALAAHGRTPADMDAWLDGAARDAVSSEALWSAVAGQLDAERLAVAP